MVHGFHPRYAEYVNSVFFYSNILSAIQNISFTKEIIESNVEFLIKILNKIIGMEHLMETITAFPHRPSQYNLKIRALHNMWRVLHQHGTSHIKYSNLIYLLYFICLLYSTCYSISVITASASCTISRNNNSEKENLNVDFDLGTQNKIYPLIEINPSLGISLRSRIRSREKSLFQSPFMCIFRFLERPQLSINRIYI